jgi:hypothetical protein
VKIPTETIGDKRRGKVLAAWAFLEEEETIGEEQGTFGKHPDGTFNHGVAGSSPAGLTNNSKGLCRIP